MGEKSVRGRIYGSELLKWAETIRHYNLGRTMSDSCPRMCPLSCVTSEYLMQPFIYIKPCNGIKDANIH